MSFLARKKKRRAKNKKSEGLSPSSDYNPDDYTWMYMLVDSVTIPERSFIRASYDSGKNVIENLCKEAIDGIIDKHWTAEEAADYIGSESLKMTQNYFNTQLSPPKSEITQRTSTQYQPLVETKELYLKIVYKVE